MRDEAMGKKEYKERLPIVVVIVCVISETNPRIMPLNREIHE